MIIFIHVAVCFVFTIKKKKAPGILMKLNFKPYIHIILNMLLTTRMTSTGRYALTAVVVIGMTLGVVYLVLVLTDQDPFSAD